VVQKQRYFKFVISASHCQQLGLYSKCYTSCDFILGPTLKAFLKKTSSIFVCKMFKLRKEKMEKIKNVLLQLSSNGNRTTGEIERQRLQSEKAR